jgi:hypothetical protein
MLSTIIITSKQLGCAQEGWAHVTLRLLATAYKVSYYPYLNFMAAAASQ